MHRDYPECVWVALHEAAILRVLGKRRHIKRDLLRGQVRKILKDEFRDYYFNSGYWRLLDCNAVRERFTKKEGDKTYMGRHKLPHRETLLRNRRNLSQPYDQWLTYPSPNRRKK